LLRPKKKGKQKWTKNHKKLVLYRETRGRAVAHSLLVGKGIISVHIVLHLSAMREGGGVCIAQSSLFEYTETELSVDVRRLLDAIVPTKLLWRRPNESKKPRRTRGSPLAVEYCDAVLATDGTEGRNDTGSVARNSSGGGGGTGTVAFFARGMITGRSADEGSTEFRSGDLIHADAAAGGRGICDGDGNDDAGEDEGDDEEGDGNGEAVVVVMTGTGGITSGNAVLLLEGVGADVDACEGPKLLLLGGGDSRGLGFSGSIAGVGDGVRMPSGMPCSGDVEYLGGGDSSARCVTGVGWSRGGMLARVRKGVGVGDGGRLYPTNFTFSSRGRSLSLLSCVTSSGDAADELVDGISSIARMAAPGALSLMLSSATGDADSVSNASVCCSEGVDVRARKVTLRLSGLSVNMGRYCDCGLNPDDALRLVFSRTVSMSCYMPVAWSSKKKKIEGGRWDL
jgi:hypothetical protein